MVNIALVGCGRVSKRYYEIFSNNEVEQGKVVAVCDKIAEKANELSSLLNCKKYYDYRELLEDDEIDLVILLTESGSHGVHAKMALEKNRHVLVEKPIALRLDEIEINAKIAAEKKLHYGVIFQNRFNPAIQLLKRTLDEQKLGKLCLGTIRLRWCRFQDYYEDGWHGTWKMDGGVAAQQGIHHIDALNWLLGPIDSVVASSCQAMNKLEAEDTLVATVKFKSGLLGAIELTTAARPVDYEASLSVISENGNVVIGGIALNNVDEWSFVEGVDLDKGDQKKYSQEVPTGYGLSHGPFVNEVVNRLNRGEINPVIDAQEGSKAIKVLHALYKSIETNQWVKLDENPQSNRLGI